MKRFPKYNNWVGPTIPLGWHTPTYSEMFYILNTRSNASNLRTLGRVQLGNGTYINGLFLLPDNWVHPVGLSMIITKTSYTDNNYSLADFELLENSGAIFFPLSAQRNGVVVSVLNDNAQYRIARSHGRFIISVQYDVLNVQVLSGINQYNGWPVRLCKTGSQFSVSATSKIDIAKSNIKYHCKNKIWAFHEHSYDVIGSDNANIDDDYDGWIDLFGFGTSGVNYSPTLHTINNADYAQSDLLGTVNDWGVNF